MPPSSYPAPEPARPKSAEPPALELDAVKIRVARFVLATPFGSQGVKAKAVASVLIGQSPELVESAVEWAVFRLLENGLLGLVREQRSPDIPGFEAYYVAPVRNRLGQLSTPVEVASFSDQTLAPTDKLRPWLDAQPPIKKQPAPKQEGVGSLSALDRKGKTPKADRNKIIKQCLDELHFKRDQVYSFLLTEHSELMTVGKRSKRRTIGERSMWADYGRWCKRRRR